MRALGADTEWREQRAALCEGFIHGTDRLVSGAMMVGPRTDEREHFMGVCDRDRAETELLEELVGDGASGRFGQAAPKLGQRRLEQFEHRRLAPGPAHAGHDPDCARER